MQNEQVAYDAFGKSAIPAAFNRAAAALAPITLTANYSDNQWVGLVKYLPNLHLDLQYISAGNGNYVEILIEYSNDEGVTYFAQSVQVPGTTEIDQYNKDGSGASGIPIVFPGDKTSANGTTYKGVVELTSVADHVRISAREHKVAGAFGTLYGRFSAKS